MNALSSYVPVTSAIRLFVLVYDLEESPLADYAMDCQCVGVRPLNGSAFTPVMRLKDINPVYAVASTYTEISSGVTPATATNRFMYHAGMEVHDGGVFEWWFRGRHGPASLIFPPSP